MNCPNCEIMRKVIAYEISHSSDMQTVENLSAAMREVTPDPSELGETPLFTEV